MSRRAYDPVKRGLDVIAAIICGVVALPVLVVVLLIVRVRLGSPVLFIQERPGRDGRIFRLLKVRTMRVAEPDAPPMTDEHRITPLGRILRSASLDELPSLLNVLRGDMSVVGPRPLLPRYLDRYSPHQARRHEVRPGITGLAQVSGRNAVSWDRRLDLDVWYVDHRSFALDARILARTVATVLKREGIAAEGVATMTEFTGEGSGRDGR